MSNQSPSHLAAQSARMKQDWDARAQENAKWYINTISREQSDEDFFASGKQDLLQWWLPEFREIVGAQNFADLKLLEIGCGIGRMTAFLAENFQEVWAVDVSSSMVEQGKLRFDSLTNIHWIDYDGINLDALPDDYFDLGFSVYVYQHVPTKEAIAANIANVYRKLKAGGCYLFLTNGIVNPEYAQIEKDTWTGASFPGADIRALASKICAQLVRLSGEGTQYCWTILRKPIESETKAQQPKIIHVGQLDDLRITTIPTSGEKAKFGILARAIDLEKIDCNNVQIQFGGVRVPALHAGKLRHRYWSFAAQNFSLSPDKIAYFECIVPADTPAGTGAISLQLADGAKSENFSIELTDGQMTRPKIVTIRNAFDYDLDIWASGAKSSLIVFADYLPANASVSNVRVQLGEAQITPSFVGFVAENATWQIQAQLPIATVPAETHIQIIFENVVSEARTIVIK